MMLLRDVSLSETGYLHIILDDPIPNYKPRRFSSPELNRAGVEIVDRYSLCLGCLDCGARWSPMLKHGGRLLRGYWLCFQGCNRPENWRYNV